MSASIGSLAAMLLALATGALAPAAPARAATEITGTVVHVVDGDSVSFVPAAGGAPIAVRLQGIDAPEICQPWGPQAREALAEHVQGQEVRLVVQGRDEHGRTLAKLMRGDLDIGERLVRDGHAWSYRYKHDRGPFVAQERMAQALRRGLHADGSALMPREFRRRNGPCQDTGAAAKVAPTAAVPAVVPSASGATRAATAPAGAVTTGTVLSLRGDARRCDGRTRCNQMTSCEEATWFLRHCPDTQMDGDGDGIPCERQWCAR
jgi:endonuclease YncB( thermonuclease family)